MKETTIEDVLKKHWDKVGDERNGMYNAALAAMTEYASLNRQGWTRVEDVKEVLEKCREYMDDRADADYENEMYQPNREAGLLVDIDFALNKLSESPVDFLKHLSDVDFDSPQVREELERVKAEIQCVLDGQIIDTSKLHIKFK